MARGTHAGVSGDGGDAGTGHPWNSPGSGMQSENQPPGSAGPPGETASHLLCLKKSQIKALSLRINFATDGRI